MLMGLMNEVRVAQELLQSSENLVVGHNRVGRRDLGRAALGLGGSELQIGLGDPGFDLTHPVLHLFEQHAVLDGPEVVLELLLQLLVLLP